MRKRLFLIIPIIFCSLISLAQQWNEVVYLKNGGMIRGTIIEQVPNESLKIQTADGSIFVYKISEVEKITKEPVKQATQTENDKRFSSEKEEVRVSDLTTKSTYSGRKKKSCVSLDLGAGIASSTWTEWSETAIEMEEALEKSVPSEYWSDFQFSKNTGFLLHAGAHYERFLKQKSPWFISAGAFAEMEKTGISAYFQGSKVMGFTTVTWNFVASAGIGMQTSPEARGLHFYWKTGIGIGYCTFNGIKARGYGEAAGLSAETAYGFGDGSFHIRPYAEIGIGGDSFFKIGIRYSPLLVNEMRVFSHCVSLSVSVPLW